MRIRHVLLSIAAATLLMPAQASATETVAEGHWEGEMVSHGQSLPVIFDFAQGAKGPEGRFTSPAQAAMDFPLDRVGIDHAHLDFVLGGSITFDGALADDALSGTFKSPDSSGTFTLRRIAPPVLPYATEEVSFRNGDVILRGTLCMPRTPGRHAAVVLLHGSGPETRWGTSRYIADQFARAGIAALVYDKRGSGTSGGDWRTASYADLARDALAGVDQLASRADIDPARIGLLGHSQGGAIGPLAANLAPGRIAFLVAEDTFAGPQSDQDIYRVRNALRELRLSPTDFDTAMRIYTLFVDASRGAKPYAEFEKQSAPYRATDWYKWMEFPPRDAWIWSWALKNGNFDTLPLWRHIHVPVLLVYGEKDALVPVDQSISKIRSALDAAKPGAPYIVMVAPNAQHNLTIQPEPDGPFFWWHKAPGVIETVVGWVGSRMRVEDPGR